MMKQGKRFLTAILSCLFVFQPFLVLISEANTRTATEISRPLHLELITHLVDPPEKISKLTIGGGVFSPDSPVVIANDGKQSLLPPPTSAVSPEKEAKVKEMIGKAPLQFIENKGQVDTRVRYYAKKAGTTIWFTDDEIVFDFMRPKKAADDDKTKEDNQSVLGDINRP
jgi:hypothetical protein